MSHAPKGCGSHSPMARRICLIKRLNIPANHPHDARADYPIPLYRQPVEHGQTGYDGKPVYAGNRSEPCVVWPLIRAKLSGWIFATRPKRNTNARAAGSRR